MIKCSIQNTCISDPLIVHSVKYINKQRDMYAAIVLDYDVIITK